MLPGLWWILFAVDFVNFGSKMAQPLCKQGVIVSKRNTHTWHFLVRDLENTYKLSTVISLFKLCTCTYVVLAQTVSSICGQHPEGARLNYSILLTQMISSLV